MRIIRMIVALMVAIDVRVRTHRPGGLLRNEDGDMGGAQQLALTAVGIAIIVGVLWPALSSGLSSMVSNMFSNFGGGGGATNVMGPGVGWA